MFINMSSFLTHKMINITNSSVLHELSLTKNKEKEWDMPTLTIIYQIYFCNRKFYVRYLPYL